VREVVQRLAEFRTISEETVIATEEKMIFKLPRELAS
jgi:4-hydroxy-3-methylbut-2-enyl diphosphate reductase